MRPELRMRRVHPIRLFALSLLLGTVSLVYLLIGSELGFDTLIFPLLKSASIRSGMEMLQARWSDIAGNSRGSCISSQHRSTSIANATSFTVDSKQIENIVQGLNLDLRQAWMSPSPSLFAQEEFSNVDFPQFSARIPALVYHKDTFLAFCEARFSGVSDWGIMRLALRRGHRRGREVAWERIRLIAGIPGYRTMNPSPIVDRRNDAIVLVFAAFFTHLNFHDMLMYLGQPSSRLYVMKSYDVGLTWSDLIEITSSTIGKMDPFPVQFAPGPGHGIQMKCGRLVVSCNFFTLDKTRKGIGHVCPDCTNRGNTIYSDDGGTTWRLGRETAPAEDITGRAIFPNEAQVAELEDGTLYVNARTLNAIQPRAFFYSHDGGQTLTDLQIHPALVEPGFRKRRGIWRAAGTGGCHGSVISVNIGKSSIVWNRSQTWLVFSNPVDPLDRVNLGLRLSLDGGRSWSEPWIVFPYFAGYSDLVYFETTGIGGKLEHNFAILYEGGNDAFFNHMKFQLFNLEAFLSNILTKEAEES